MQHACVAIAVAHELLVFLSTLQPPSLCEQDIRYESGRYELNETVIVVVNGDLSISKLNSDYELSIYERHSQ
jgi:hypothetical protein